ncbi:MAG TPA: TetR/AcrR family transcriptional regulator, partial [Cycloclasticus sp.]|nr:TetR/AcrR family transcriptional regulator [Cycloclasticus sp.]
MARTRQFDKNEAVNKALAVFRSQGYKATSLADLIKAMGLSRSSLYETFGSKHDLFLTTLASFDKTLAF